MNYAIKILEEELSKELERKATADLFTGGTAGCDREWFNDMMRSFDNSSRNASERIPQLKAALEKLKAE